MCIIENIPVKNYELLESVVGKIHIPNTAMEYWQKIYHQEGQKRGKLKISAYQYLVGYECGKGFESCL
jgi:predicted metalloprotease